MTDHALLLARTLGLRPPSNADLPFMIEAAAQSAWSTNRGQPIVAARCEDRSSGARGHRAHRHRGAGRAYKRATDALLSGLSSAQLAKLDTLLITDPALKATPYGSLKNASTSPKPDHVRALLDRLRFVRDTGVVKAGLSPTAVAKQLGLGRSTVYREISRAGIERAPQSA
jgi:hypothetical protein